MHGTYGEGHLKHLQMIFEEIWKVGLKLNLPKCAFFKKYL